MSIKVDILPAYPLEAQDDQTYSESGSKMKKSQIPLDKESNILVVY